MKKNDQPTASVRIVTREPHATRRPAIELSDIRIAASLPIYAAAAWFVPAMRWYKLIRRWLTSIEKKGSLLPISRGVEASGLELAYTGDSETIARELNANRLESYLQYLRDYRPGGWQGSLSICNEKALSNRLEGGRGVILWVGHFVFNGLPLKKALHQAGYRVFHLSRPEHGFSSSHFGIRFLNPLRSRIECRYLAERVIIARGAEYKAMQKAHELLSKGEVVSITAGHWEGRRIALAPIGKARLPISIGPPALASMTGAALLPLFVVCDRTRGPTRFRAIVGESIDCPKWHDRDRAVGCAVAEFVRQLTPYVARYPDQWRGWKYVQTSDGTA